MRTVQLSIPVLTAILLASALPAQAENMEDMKDMKDMFTPVVASPLRPTVFAVPGTDNKLHLVYELVITNTGNVPATLQKVEVVSSDTPSRVLATFQGAALLRRLRTAGRGPEPGPQIPFSGTRLLLVDFTMDRDARGIPPPARLLHRFQLLAAQPHGKPTDPAVPFTYTIAPIAVSTDITVLGPPLTGNHWAALNGCCQAGGVHRGTSIPVNGQIHFAQRFAIDWMQLNADAKFSRNDGKNVKDYADYGAKVIAVADGTVVETVDSLDDQVPGELPDPKTINIDNIDGNHIVQDLGHGRYAFYAHLQKNSLLVAKGNRVKRGQALALLGNTGNTSAPHLHFHLMDGISVLGSSGLPYVIDHFNVAGQLSREQFDATGIDKPWTKDLSAHPSSRDSEFPLDLTLINFQP